MKRATGFFDVAQTLSPEVVISYRSGMFVFEEGLRDGRFVALAYSASGCMRSANPLPAPKYMDVSQLARPQSFLGRLGSRQINENLEYLGLKTQRREDGMTARVRLRCRRLPVEIDIVTELDGSGVLSRLVEIRNTGSASLPLDEFSPLAGGVQMFSKAAWQEATATGKPPYRLGYFRDEAWGREGDFAWMSLPEAETSIGGRYRWDRFRHPMACVENAVTGESLILQLGYSGGYRFSFSYRAPDKGDAHLYQEIALDAPETLRVIAPGETWISPRVHFGMFFGGLDEAVNGMHAHLRKCFLPKADDLRERVGTGIGPEYCMSQENTLLAMECAADVGSEVFWIDAGWYAPPGKETEWFIRAGDWRANRERYPDGLAPLRERCHELGMRFGLWMEAERLGAASTARTKHPDWLQKDGQGRPNASGWLDMGIPECAAWVEEQIAGLILNERLDFFRLDYNVPWRDTLGVRESEGMPENTWDRHLSALTGMFVRLRERFPQVIFENCAAGGARTDVGMASVFHHTWVTDWQIHPRAFRITNGMTMALPPEHIDRLVGGQNGFLTADMRTQLRNQLFTHMSVGVITPGGQIGNEEQLDMIREHISLYKRFVRPMLPNSKIYHHTPCLDDAPCGILELAARNGSRGMLGVFVREGQVGWTGVVRLKGASEGYMYRVRFDNSGCEAEISGWELVHRGLTLDLNGSLTSELITYQAIGKNGEEIAI